MKSKIWLLVIGVCLIFTGPAFGYAITKSTSAEFAAGGATLTNLRTTDAGVILKISGGSAWASNVLVNSVSGKVTDEVSMAGDGQGGVFLAWRDIRFSQKGVIYAARVASSGVKQWEISFEAKDKDGLPATMESPCIIKSVNAGAVDGAILAWMDQRNFSRDIYASKIDLEHNKKWSPTVILFTETQDKPRLVSDNSGGAAITWQDYRSSNSAVYAQKLNSFGTREWTSTGIEVCPDSVSSVHTNASNPQIVREGGTTQAYLIAWEDHRDGADRDEIYAMRVKTDGTLDKDHFGSYGKSVVDTALSTGKKDAFILTNAYYPPNYVLPIFVWRDTGETNQSVYAQWLTGDGIRRWGETGVRVSNFVTSILRPVVAGTTNADAIFSWLTQTSGAYDCLIQKLNASAEAQWTAGGVNIAPPGIYNLAYDGAGGMYASAVGVSGSSYLPYAQRIGPSGNELWDENGVMLSSSPLVLSDNALPIVTCESGGAIIAWVDSTSKDLYAQKVTDLYYAGGIWTSEQIQNPNPAPIWGPMTWETTGAVTAEVRTASSSSVLGSAGWSSISNGGTIPSNGPWIQARMYLSPDSTRTTTAVLNSLSFNYSLDTAYPSVESVTIRGETLSPSTRMWVATTPTIDAVLTDDRRIASAEVKIDDVSIGYTSLSSTDTRWSIRSQVTSALLAENHSLKVEVTDDAGNKTTGTYPIAVATKKEVEGSTAAFAEGSKIIINYTLTADTTVTVEIRNLFTGELIRKTVVVSGATGGAAGDNTISIEAGDLGKGVYGYTIYPSGGAPVTGKFAIQ